MLKPSKFDIDFTAVENTLSNKKAYKLSEVKDRLETVAFDIVRFKSPDESANLWQVQSSDDGKEDFIVSLYQDAEEPTAELTKAASNIPWEVSLSKTAVAIDIYYKGDPIVRLSAKQLAIPAAELPSVPRYLPKKLSENKSLVSSLLSELTDAAKQAVVSKYPELL